MKMINVKAGSNAFVNVSLLTLNFEYKTSEFVLNLHSRRADSVFSVPVDCKYVQDKISENILDVIK